MLLAIGFFAALEMSDSVKPPSRRYRSRVRVEQANSERLAHQTRHLRLLVGDALRPGLDPEEAAERFCALSSPEMHHLVTSELGWTPQAHEAWLTALTEAELLGDERRRADG